MTRQQLGWLDLEMVVHWEGEGLENLRVGEDAGLDHIHVLNRGYIRKLARKGCKTYFHVCGVEQRVRERYLMMGREGVLEEENPCLGASEGQASVRLYVLVCETGYEKSAGEGGEYVLPY